MKYSALWVTLLLSCHSSSQWPEFENDERPAKGFAVSLHPEATRRAGFDFPPDLTELVPLGATHILVPIELSMEHSAASSVISPSYHNTRAVMWEAHRASLTPILMPFITLRQASAKQWRGNIRPQHTEKWWHSYTDAIVDYAKISQVSGLPMLVIGSELSSMSKDARRWCELSERVREVFDGKLALVANHDALDLLAPFKCVDVAGVSAYFPLSESHEPSMSQLRQSWEHAGASLRDFAAEVDKPLILFEVGYPSVDGAAMAPWNSASGSPIDLQEQEDCFRAAADEISTDLSWMSGVFVWTWLGPGGPHDAHYTPRAKPAIHQVKRLLSTSFQDTARTR